MDNKTINNLNSEDREENRDDCFENLPDLNSDENYSNYVLDESLLEHQILQTPQDTFDNVDVPTTLTLNSILKNTVKLSGIFENSSDNKYKIYQYLSKRIKDRENVNTYDGSEDVKKIINWLRGEYKRKLIRCSFCKKKKSIDIVFTHAQTNKVICRDCAKKGTFERKKDLLDYVEEEPSIIHCLRCNRCHAYREMNQFRVKRWKKMNKITYCKFCSNIRYLTS